MGGSIGGVGCMRGGWGRVHERGGGGCMRGMGA